LDTLVNFTSANGSFPEAPLVQATDGNFYGTTSEGGVNNRGTVFTMTPEGKVTTLHSFCSQNPNCADGAFPTAGLVQGMDGNFYGTTASGGVPTQFGTVFKITSDGSLTTLHIFLFVDGFLPRGLVQGTDGNLYGITYQGGINKGCWDGDSVACGTVFKITPDGVFTTLYNFCSQSDCLDGAQPRAGLVQGADGNFYGTTYSGGGASSCTGGCGTIFKITSNGALSTLYSFCSQSSCPDGRYPNGKLVQGIDKNFYGTTSEGGAGAFYSDLGSVFKLTPDGQLTTLYSFCSLSGCADGAVPNAGLLQGTDHSFYGTTSDWGANGRGGTVFKISSIGLLTTLYSFCSHGVVPYPCTDSGNPNAELVQGTNGKFYGTAAGRLVNNCVSRCGSVFSFGTGLDLRPNSGIVGLGIRIVGLNLTGATGVRFNHAAATFTVISATHIATSVPNGALTGKVRVTTPGGVLTSNTVFLVTPHIKSFKPIAGPAGTSVIITGTSFTKAIHVTFGGVESTNYTVDSDSQVTAIVPSGAVTGKIAITTSGGTGTSVGTFTVTQ
jgi:uncharacterized repeat protein (TIGR03803 family)